MHDATRTTESPQCQPTFQHQSLVTKVSPKWSSTRKQIIWLYKSYQTNIITTISDSNHLQYFFKTTVLWHFSICRATFSMATEGRNFTSIQSSSPSRAISSDIQASWGLFKLPSSDLQDPWGLFKWPSSTLKLSDLRKVMRGKGGHLCNIRLVFFTNNAVLAHEVCTFSKN